MTTVIHTKVTGQPFVNVAKHERMVDPASLTAHQQRMLWEGIKILDPFLADLITGDANIAALKQTFNASIQFTVPDFNRYLQAGLKALEERKP
jgi:hypothetical protein